MQNSETAAVESPREVVRLIQQSMAAAVAQSLGLSPFREVATRVMEVLRNPNYQTTELVVVLESDPAMMSKVLRLANSAMIASRTPCFGVRQAIIRLGSKTVRSLVAAAVAMELFCDDEGLGLTIRDHCSAVGTIAQKLAGVVGHREPAVVYLSGLLHDVGKLLLLQTGEVEYAGLDPMLMTRPNVLHDVERQLVGFDHAELGAWVLDLWSLPAPVPAVTRLHHADAAIVATSPNAQIVGLVRLANRLDFLLADPEVDPRIAVALADDLVLAGLEWSAVEGVWDDLRAARRVARTMFHDGGS